MGIFLKLLANQDLENQITTLGTKTVLVASVVLVVCTILAAILKDKIRAVKLPLFIVMASTLLGTTILLFGSTIYLNIKSESGGPVHWHADIEYWACGTEIELRNPSGTLSNKIGSSTFHEHNDKRIHLEGVVVRKSEDATLEKFMRLAGGYVEKDRIAIPLNESPDEWFVSGESLDGDPQSDRHVFQLKEYVKSTDDGPVLELHNGQKCGDKDAELQLFVYSFDKTHKTYSQQKLDNAKKYMMRDEPIVPPGDCVIVEFDTPKAQTDKLCRQYGVRDEKRCTQFGVKSHTPELCNIRETSEVSQ